MSTTAQMDIAGAVLIIVAIVAMIAVVARSMHKQRVQEVDSARDLGFSEGFDSGFQSGMSALHPNDPVTEVYDFEEHGGV